MCLLSSFLYSGQWPQASKYEALPIPLVYTAKTGRREKLRNTNRSKTKPSQPQTGQQMKHEEQTKCKQQQTDRKRKNTWTKYTEANRSQVILIRTITREGTQDETGSNST